MGRVSSQVRNCDGLRFHSHRGRKRNTVPRGNSGDAQTEPHGGGDRVIIGGGGGMRGGTLIHGQSYEREEWRPNPRSTEPGTHVKYVRRGRNYPLIKL